MNLDAILGARNVPTPARTREQEAATMLWDGV